MLYLVATPIGNLSDITLRAIEVLKTVDFVASEDTRRTGLLLKHLGVSRPQMAFHEHNERRATQRIMDLLHGGKSVALVADAGTPCVSDPGFVLVRAAPSPFEAFLPLKAGRDGGSWQSMPKAHTPLSSMRVPIG
jgi:16S rRNA (cytidine1402-2'-O)-methyltransferase